MYWVYVLKCVDEGLYIGCTDNLRKRFEAHKNGLVKATKYRLPVILYECFAHRYCANCIYKINKCAICNFQI